MQRRASKQQQQSESQSQPESDDSEEQVQERFVPRVDRNLNYQPDYHHVIINVAFTNYPIVREVALKLGFKVINQPEQINWDLCWTDHPIAPQTFIRMHFHQTINYLTGIHTIARKNQLGKRLNIVHQTLPQQFDFHPKTWMLPDEFALLRRYMDSQGRRQTLIVKPEADCQGRGIYLVNRIQDIIMGRRCVVQKYLDNPLLIDNFKFDLRVYVLIGSVDPLRIYLYHDGLARFATEAYQSAQKQNFKSCYQHLTNYAINKHNPKFKEAQSGIDGQGGFKRSLRAVFNKLAQNGVDTAAIWQKISDIAVKTVLLGYQKMRHNYVSSQPQQYHNHMAFHVLGLDIFIDQNHEPFLLEVNHTPSFATETPLDYRVKYNLIKDTLVLMNCNSSSLKQQLFSKSKIVSNNRIQNGIRQSLQQDIRCESIQQQLSKRIQYEADKMGGYTLIYPCSHNQRQNKFTIISSKVKKLLDHKKHKPKKKQQEKSHKQIEKVKAKAQTQKKIKQTVITSRQQKPQKLYSKQQPQKPYQKQQQKKAQISRLKRHSLHSERTTQTNMHKTILNYVKYDLNSINEHTQTWLHHEQRNNRTFTIKTKFSIPDVHSKKIGYLQEQSKRTVYESPKIQKNKLGTPICSNTKEGNFIKPRTYDAPSLVITSNYSEEHKIIKKRNKNGKIIFHISKPGS